MKRLPVLISFAGFLCLCASIAFWGMRMMKGQVRGVSAPASQQSFEPAAGMWGGIFGDAQMQQNAPSVYQLKGVILSKSGVGSVALIASDGKPAKPVRVGEECAPGVLVKEIAAKFVQISDGGVIRRIELPQVQILPLSTALVGQADTSNLAVNAFPVKNVSGASAMHTPPPPPNLPMIVPGVPAASMPASMGG